MFAGNDLRENVKGNSLGSVLDYFANLQKKKTDYGCP